MTDEDRLQQRAKEIARRLYRDDPVDERGWGKQMPTGRRRTLEDLDPEERADAEAKLREKGLLGLSLGAMLDGFAAVDAAAIRTRVDTRTE
jgi:hypothetical protein